MKKGITTRSFSLLLALLLIASTVSAALAAPGDTTHVSRSTGGIVANNGASSPAISANGRYIAFQSATSNLVAGDTNGMGDIFLRDTSDNTTIRVSVATDGTQGEWHSTNPSISADGRYVAFDTGANNLVPNDTNGGTDIFVRDTQTNVTVIASLDNNGNVANLASSWLPAISADGRYVAFASDGILVNGDSNFATDIYVRDLQSNTTHLISVASDGTQANSTSDSPAISADGRYVAFQSSATNLVPGDTNGVNDIFLRDRQTNTTTRISVATDGTQANLNTSGWQCPLAISGDGRYVVFESNASNLVDGDTNGNPDVFVRDIQYGITQRVSVASDGTQATGWSQHSAISSDGSAVAFSSSAINLVASVTGQQIFKHELGWSSAPSPTVISIKRANANPTSAASVDFKVLFSQYVTGVDAGDFTLTTNGVTGASIASVSGSGNIYTVTVNTGSGDGTIRLDVVDDDSIKNAANSPLGGVGAGNGNFTLGETYTTDKSPIFDDVPATYWAWQQIERLYNAGITGGCTTSPLNYCPESEVTRAQMAVFLERGLHYPATFTAPDVESTFTDTDGHWAEDWIEALKNDGITAGCAAGLYCPENPVTRAQMAVFLLKAKYGSSYTPPLVGVSTGFDDVPTSHWAAVWIKQLAAEQITGGCGGGNYCPESPVTRAQMAVFLVKTFNLP